MKSVKARADQFDSQLDECRKDRGNLIELLNDLGEKTHQSHCREY